MAGSGVGCERRGWREPRGSRGRRPPAGPRRSYTRLGRKAEAVGPSGQIGEPTRWTRPAFRHEVQTFRRGGAPFTRARTFWMFGSQRRGVRWWEWETLIPNPGRLPQMSHTAAMARGMVAAGLVPAPQPADGGAGRRRVRRRKNRASPTAATHAAPMAMGAAGLELVGARATAEGDEGVEVGLVLGVGETPVIEILSVLLPTMSIPLVSCSWSR